MSWIKQYIDKCHERGLNPYNATIHHEVAMEVEIERIAYEKRIQSRARIRRVLCGYYRFHKFLQKFSLNK